MSRKRWLQLVSVVLLFVGVYCVFFVPDFFNEGLLEVERVGYHPENFYTFTVDPKSNDLRFVWRDSEQDRFGSIGTWKTELEKEGVELVFAMNGGMYEKDGSPKGLFIKHGVTQAQIDLAEKGYGNFYLQPNGVMFITSDNRAGICKTSDFSEENKIKYATQSGPMLLIDAHINDLFRSESDNRHIRNGVGVLGDGRLIFAMSKTKVNFHDFAYFFKQSGCKNALYLDGFVSRMYAPASGVEQLGGDFGVMIGVLK